MNFNKMSNNEFDKSPNFQQAVQNLGIPIGGLKNPSNFSTN